MNGSAGLTLFGLSAAEIAASTSAALASKAIGGGPDVLQHAVGVRPHEVQHERRRSPSSVSVWTVVRTGAVVPVRIDSVSTTTVSLRFGVKPVPSIAGTANGPAASSRVNVT